jgi:hypothetical protein
VRSSLGGHIGYSVEMALRSTIHAFEQGGISNVTPNSKRKRSIYDAEVVRKTFPHPLALLPIIFDIALGAYPHSNGFLPLAKKDQKIDLFESLKGQEEHRRRGPMYRRFGNLKQKFEADLRSLQSEDKENIVNQQPSGTFYRPPPVY